MGRFVSAVTRRAAANGSSAFLTQTLRVSLYGLMKAMYAPVGRDLGAGDLGVAEEQLAVDERCGRRAGVGLRRCGSGRLGQGRHCERQRRERRDGHAGAHERDEGTGHVGSSRKVGSGRREPGGSLSDGRG